MNNKKSFILHKDSLVVLEHMTDEQAGLLFKLIYEYQITGEVPEMDFGMTMALTPFINQFKRDEGVYQKTCQKNKNNGLKGGRPKNPKNPVGFSETQKTQTNPNKPDSDSDSENDSGSENKKENKIKDLKKNKTKKVPPIVDKIPKTKMEQVFEKFLRYRKQINKPYKSEMSINLGFKKLQKLSNNNPKTALEIVNQAIANGWQGFFALTQQTKQQKKGVSQGTGIEAKEDSHIDFDRIDGEL